MPKFPKAEPEIVALAQEIVAGLSANSSVYPASPVSSEQLTARVNAYQTARTAATAAQAAAKKATATKDETLASLIEDMRSILRYAENEVKYDDKQLTLLGWGGRSKRNTLPTPGQVRRLQAIRQGDDWVSLNWKQPAEGGRVNAYKVQCRLLSGGKWKDVSMAIEPKITLMEQPQGQKLEYRIVAVNRSGEGMASNAVPVVL